MYRWDYKQFMYVSETVLDNGYRVRVELDDWLGNGIINLGLFSYSGELPENWSCREGHLTGPGGVSVFQPALESVRYAVNHLGTLFPGAVALEVSSCGFRHSRIYRRYLEPMGFEYRDFDGTLTKYA